MLHCETNGNVLISIQAVFPVLIEGMKTKQRQNDVPSVEYFYTPLLKVFLQKEPGIREDYALVETSLSLANSKDTEIQ